MLCAKFYEIGPVALEKKIFKNFVNALSTLILYYLPIKKDAPFLNKLVSHSPKDALCDVWLKLAQWFWGRIFEKFIDRETDYDGQQAIRKAHLDRTDSKRL